MALLFMYCRMKYHLVNKNKTIVWIVNNIHHIVGFNGKTTKQKMIEASVKCAQCDHQDNTDIIEK
jgi:hypothetical protein